MKQMPIWRDANRLLLEVEQAVRGFSRYHKYSVGTDLRRQAMGIVRLLSRAYHAEGDRRSQVRRLRAARLPYQLVEEEGYLPDGMKRRVLRQPFHPQPRAERTPPPPGFTPVLRSP